MEMGDNIGQARTPENRRRRLTREQLIAVGSILMAELFERLAFYSIFGNLMLFSTSSLNFSNDNAYFIALLYKGKRICLLRVGWRGDVVVRRWTVIPEVRGSIPGLASIFLRLFVFLTQTRGELV